MKNALKVLGWIILLAGAFGSFVLGSELGRYDFNLYAFFAGIFSSAILGFSLIGFGTALELLEENRDNTNRLLQYLKEKDNKKNTFDKTGVVENKAREEQISKEELEHKIQEYAGKTGINPQGKEAVYPIPCNDPGKVYCPACNTLQVEGRHVCQKCGIPFMY